MSATSATGGVPPRAIATTLTAGACTTAARARAGTTTIRTACLVFGACRTRRFGFGYAQPPLIERSRNERAGAAVRFFVYYKYVCGKCCL